MKKIKVLLASIAVVAVVGGALAFKANKFASFCVYKLNAQKTACPRLAIGDPWVNLPSITVTEATTSPACPAAVDPALCTTTVTYQAEL